MKEVKLEPINKNIQVKTNQDLLQGLLSENLKIMMSCGGRGMCATCHVYITDGHQQLTPPTEREQKTLGYVTGATANSRLACQCRVLGEGIVVKLPDGMYVEKEQDLIDMIGKRAETNILHPGDGSILIAKGKLITKSRVVKLKKLKIQLEDK